MSEATRQPSGLSLEQCRASLRLLTTEISRVQDEERHRIARVIHDDLGQLLAAVRIRLGELRAGSGPDDAAMVDELDRLVTRAIDVSRSLAVEMIVSPRGDDVGSALAGLADRFQHRNSIRCSFTSDGSEERLSADAAAALFRVAREALTNIARHAGATEAGITVQGGNGVVRVIVHDDGCGFQPGASKRPGRNGVGLVIARERMAEVDGQLTIDAAPGAGTRVIASAPVEPIALLRAAP